MVGSGLVLVVGSTAIGVALVVALIRSPGSRARAVALAVFGLYLVLVVGATMFPIALDSFGEARPETLVYLEPLRGLLDAGDIARRQALANILLGVPFGFGVFFVARRIKPWMALLAGAGFFFCVEFLQLLILLAFPGSPRSTDVTDWMLNTMGVAFGILGFVLFADWFVRVDHKADLSSSTWVDYLRSVVRSGQGQGTGDVSREGSDEGRSENE